MTTATSLTTEEIYAAQTWCLGKYIQSTMRLINERWQLQQVSTRSVAIFVHRPAIA
jgi:hypothetical protein